MNEFILGDCMDYLPLMKDNEFDLAIVDPPYGIGINTMSYTNGVVWTKNASAKRRDYTIDSKWDVAPTKEYFDELLRVSKKQVVWGAITLLISCHRQNHLLYGIKGVLIIWLIVLRIASMRGVQAIWVWQEFLGIYGKVCFKVI